MSKLELFIEYFGQPDNYTTWCSSIHWGVWDINEKERHADEQIDGWLSLSHMEILF